MTTIKTVFEAEMSGTLAAMSSDAKREVPAEYAQRPALREAWENAFDKMRQELRGTPVEAPKTKKEKAPVDEESEEPTKTKNARKRRVTAQEAPEPVPAVAEKQKRMDDICLELHPEAREYA